MLTLGINAAFHDPASALVKDGQIIAAAEEERFNHVKHGKRPIPFSTYELPFNAINYCLKEAGVHLGDIDHIAYSFDPYPLLGEEAQKTGITIPLEPSAHAPSELWRSPWDPLFLSSIVNAPRHLLGGFPHHLQKRFKGAGLGRKFRWHFVEHHLAHAASAFHASPFDEAAVITLDGRGEDATTTYAQGKNGDIHVLGTVNMPHSLGLLYEEITRYLGFLHSSDEYKVMALASFGRPRFLSEFHDILKLEEKGRYTVQELRLSERFGPSREKGGPLDQRHFDIASSLQAALEEAVLKISSWLHGETGAQNLCLAGGVALNCVMNAKIRDRGPFENVWVQPAAGDAGTALGAALLVDAKFNTSSAAPRGPSKDSSQNPMKGMSHAYLGPSFSDEEIQEFLLWSKLPFKKLVNVAEETADLLSRDKIIGWFQGRMEFGPRALGARSILASPIHPEMQQRLNEIKEREDFRPVAPVVLEEEASHWFKGARPSPYMLFVFDVLPAKAPLIPAVTHVDGSARIQTINREQNPVYYDLLKAFHRKTGVPILVNTSFNTRGEPIVCTPRDAIECFWTSPLDALVIGSFLLEKAPSS